MSYVHLYREASARPPGSRYDAIIVGSGPGGSAVAYRLAQAGRKVLVVERGSSFEANGPAPSGAIGHYLYDHIAMGESAAQFLGGQSKFYGAAMYRLRASDFVDTRHETATSPAWPFDYSTLEPYYGTAEALYKVHGDPASDNTEPPRSQPLPYGPLPHSPIVKRCVEKLEASGTRTSSIPRALDYGPDGKCVLCATCDAYYCSLDAKMDAEKATLRPALATGNIDIALNAECLRVVTDTSGTQVTGVVIRHHGVERLIEAEQVVVGAGLPGTMQLLWKSRTSRHPAGLGNTHGNLGRYLGGHWTGMFFPLLSWRSLPANHTKTFSINSLYDGAPDWPFPLGVIQLAGQVPYWRFSSRLMRLPAWLIAQRSLMCFYMIEAVPGEQSGFSVTPEGIGPKTEPVVSPRTFDQARMRARKMFKKAGFPVIARRQLPFLWHEVGTARMGNDPRTSVCDASGRVHDIRNLYIADASVLPSAGAVNTCLTIVAVALKTADAMLSATHGASTR